MYVTLQSSTRFKHQHAHLQEDKLYYHSIWYRHCTAVQYAGSCIKVGKLNNSIYFWGSHDVYILYLSCVRGQRLAWSSLGNMSHTRMSMGWIKKNLWRGLVASQQTFLIKEEILNEEEVDKGKVIFKTCKF